MCSNSRCEVKLLLGKLRILLHGEIGVGEVAVGKLVTGEISGWENCCWGSCNWGNFLTPFERFTSLGSKDIGIRKLDLETRLQFRCTNLNC